MWACGQNVGSSASFTLDLCRTYTWGVDTPQANFCTSCGNQIAQGSSFCSSCGAATAKTHEVNTGGSRFNFSLDNLTKPSTSRDEMPAWLKQGIFWFAISMLVITLLQAFGL
jgi:hypothetical protein